MKQKKSTIIKVVGIIAILTGATLGIYFGFFYSQPNVKSKPYNVMISEIKYKSESGIPIDDQFIEIYSFTNFSNGLFSGWYIETRDGTGNEVLGKTPLPNLSLYGEFWHLCIYGNTSALNINASAKKIELHLNLTSPMLDEDGGQILLYYNNGTEYLVDLVCYGDIQSTIQVPSGNEWDKNDGGAKTNNQSESVSIWGWDEDGSHNWYNDTPTPGAFNNLHNVVLDPAGNGSVADVPEVIYNGFLNHYPEYYGAHTPSPVPINVTNAHPAPGVSTDTIKEMVEATIKYLSEFGRKTGPKLGNDSALDIHIGIHPGANSSMGRCYENGSIYIWVGNEIRSADATRKYRGKVDLKYTVEHEVTHAYQYEQGIIREGNEPFYEGEATYWGIYSTARNFNITVKDVNTIIGQIENTNGVPGQSWDHHGKSLNTPTFGNGTENGTTRWEFTHSHYCNGFLLLKFINETFGPDTVRNITNSMNETVGYEEAMEAATGLSFQELLRRYYQWRCDYTAEDDNGVPAVDPDEDIVYGNNNHSSTESVSPNGAAVEDLVHLGSDPYEIWITPEPGQSVSVTVIMEKPDGTVETTHHTVSNTPGSTQAPIVVDPSKYSAVRLVKMNLNKTDECNVTMEIKTGLGMYNKPSAPPNPPDYNRTPGHAGPPYNETCNCVGSTGTVFASYFCNVSEVFLSPTNFTVYLDVSTYAGTDLVAHPPDWMIYIHLYNEATREPMWVSGPIAPDPGIEQTIEILSEHTAGTGCFVVAEIMDENVDNILSFFIFEFDYSPL